MNLEVKGEADEAGGRVPCTSGRPSLPRRLWLFLSTPRLSPGLLRAGPQSPAALRLPPGRLEEEAVVLFEEGASARWEVLPQLLGAKRLLNPALRDLQTRPARVS